MGNEAYQERDAAFFDYKLFERFDFSLRGPEWPIDEPADFNLVGSARVFGRFVDKPLTTLLQDEHGIRAHNLGTAGGNPFMYMKRPDFLNYLATSKAVPIVQVCGADGHSNDWFTRITGRTMRVKKDGLGLQVGTNVRGGVGYRTAFKQLPFAEVVEQIRKGQQFILDDYRELKAALGRPAVIMYFSDRPARKLTKRTYRDLFKFPHCVDRDMWEELKTIFEYSLEIVSDDGMPYTVTDGKTSVKVDLYPSEAMHRTAANEIAKHRDAIMAVADAPPKPVAVTRKPLAEAPPRRARKAASPAAASAPTPVSAEVRERRRKAAEVRRQRREAGGSN